MIGIGSKYEEVKTAYENKIEKSALGKEIIVADSIFIGASAE